jgi:diadenylate cyclase
MEIIENILRRGSVIDVIDILIVASFFYWIMLLVRGTRAERMLWGLAVVVFVFFISRRLEFFTLHWILNNFLASIVIIIIVVFQQDIRRALMQVGRPFSSRESVRSAEFVEEIAKAASSMSSARMGGLIVIERGVDLRDFLEAGVSIDAKLTKELLLTIFNPGAPLHDGAVVIRDGRVIKAGCILPLTAKELTGSMGTRHRAALGLTEETDAVVIVVSENTGEVSLVVEERIETGPDLKVLFARLKKIFIAEQRPRKGFFPWKVFGFIPKG